MRKSFVKCIRVSELHLTACSLLDTHMTSSAPCASVSNGVSPSPPQFTSHRPCFELLRRVVHLSKSLAKAVFSIKLPALPPPAPVSDTCHGVTHNVNCSIMGLFPVLPIVPTLHFLPYMSKMCCMHWQVVVSSCVEALRLSAWTAAPSWGCGEKPWPHPRWGEYSFMSVQLKCKEDMQYIQ